LAAFAPRKQERLRKPVERHFRPAREQMRAAEKGQTPRPILRLSGAAIGGQLLRLRRGDEI